MHVPAPLQHGPVAPVRREQESLLKWTDARTSFLGSGRRSRVRSARTARFPIRAQPGETSGLEWRNRRRGALDRGDVRVRGAERQSEQTATVNEMPINYRVDHAGRIVIAVGHGALIHSDVFGYQRDVWSRADVAGFDELIDMTRVTEIALSSTDRVRDLATLAAGMDGTTRSRLAIVASADFPFAIGRMFQTYRQLAAHSTKEIGVFRTMEEALTFLGISHPPEMPAMT
jgi:hypothetical protein